MNFRNFKMIFFNTINKEYRNKGLLFLTIITIAFLLGLNAFFSYVYQNFVDNSSLGGVIGDKTMIGLFYFVNFWASFLGVLLGVNCIRSDFESGVVSQILSFPIKRSEYFLARVLGTWSMVNLYFIFSLILALALLSLSSKVLIFSTPMIYAFLLSNLNILAAILFGATVSLFLPKLFSFISVIILSALISMSNSMVNSSGVEAFIKDLNLYKVVGLVLHYTFPRMGDFNTIIGSFLLGRTNTISIGLTLGHFAFSFLALYAIVQFFFNKKEI